MAKARLPHRSSISRAIFAGIFNFIGIEPEFVFADGLAISPEQRELSVSTALGETLRLAA